MSGILGVPCYNCICVPMCRNKVFHQLCSECVFVNNYLSDIPNEEVPLAHYYWVQYVLRPSDWEVESLKATTLKVNHKKG